MNSRSPRGRVTCTCAIGTAPHGIDLSDNGATLFATSKAENKLVAVDLGTGKTREIPLSPAPYHLTAVRGSATLYVSSRAENRIWVIDQESLATRDEIAIDGVGHQMAVAAH
jgi:DNA-binding beta-propeller fold protein YncE